MKKKLAYILLILPFLWVHTGNAFLDGDLWIDIFKTIDDGLSATQNKMYKHEMTWHGKRTISQELNSAFQSQGLGACIAENIKLEDIEKIKAWDTDTLVKLIKPECMDTEKNTVSINTLATFRRNIANVDAIKRRHAEERTQRIYNIARIWLYSDGDTTNSPFDLIDDIKEIEKIIFSQNLEYNGVIMDLDKEFDAFLDGYGWRTWSSSGRGTGSWIFTGPWSTWSGIWVEDRRSIPYSFYTQTGTYVCTDTSTNVLTSGLSEETINILINNTGSTNTWSTSGSGSNSWSGSNFWNGNIDSVPTYWYSKVNDNSLWPCNEFFCIRIEFVIKNYKLLTGWKSWSIEWILKKSNEHLKKFAGSSGIQWEMTKNNFSLGTVNLNLANIFHMWVQIQTRTPPILNIEKNTSRLDETEFAYKNIQYQLYKDAWIDSQRPHSIDNYLSVPEELKMVEVIWERPYVDIVSLRQSLATIKQIKARRNDYFSQSINARAASEDLDIYFKEFIELEKFWQAFKEYVDAMTKIIKEMNKIPVKES